MCVICENKITECHELFIKCDQIKEIKELPKNIKILTLVNCNNLEVINEDLKLNEIIIDNCYNIKTLPISLTKLHIEHGNINYETLSKLLFLERLEYYRCHLELFPSFNNLKYLIIEKSYIKNLEGKNYPSLEFLLCKESRIEEIKNFNNLKRISCYSCKNLKNISNVPNLKSLDCRYCLNLENIDTENELERLECSECDKLVKFPNSKCIINLN